VLLRQRGYLVLHASAVACRHRAAVFLGASGWGKSTLAAALHQRGFPFIADDVVAIDTGKAVPVVLPGVPQVKLWPDAVAALHEDTAALPRVHPQFEKRVRPLSAPIVTEPAPLGRLYVLADGPAPALEPVAPREALVELLRHSYGARTLQHVRREAHFLQCAAVARAVPVARLAYPRALERLPEAIRLVEADAARTARPAG
jgi:hypothetical protein